MSIAEKSTIQRRKLEQLWEDLKEIKGLLNFDLEKEMEEIK